ncbi:bifunctional metallophosphatase/5'-nucleotidase [Rugamonas apoptosis]|uniref:Bifunctional metallophosphatase/5'-nucleotidase n=1 Tax=Rugamonas apoptosis TaxID=2758570 RepID=A0A7W2FAY5_9BURK|nr:bifunctional metallophosphatase/5'-nucleotidase [Rugamonas apoptosis]MBA5688376.1 bifunctional metallophosphatase/5'-nucleotidase [Rugamonas apoptosis]
MNSLLRPLAAAALAALLAACASPPPPPHTAVINLVALNDFHGNLEPSAYTYTSARDRRETTAQAGGIDALGAALQAWRKDDSELLLVGAGDMVGASPSISSMWADEPAVGALDLLGLRASALGNHEFDLGRAELLRQQKGGCVSPRADKACQFAPNYGGAHFSYLAANVLDMVTRKPIVPAYQIETAHGVRVAFIGAVLKDTAALSLPSSVSGLEFTDEANAINALLPELRKQGVGVFVVLIHQGGRTTDYFDQPGCDHLTGPIVDIVKRLDPAIRLVVSGHSHKGYLCQVDGRVVTQAETAGHVLSRIRLTVDTADNRVRAISASNEVMLAGRYPADPALDAWLARVRARGTAALARSVGRLAVPVVPLDKDDVDESPLGDLVADATLQAGAPFGAQIAFMNLGGMRHDLAAGKDGSVTLGQVQTVLPFVNTVVVMNLTGAQIATLLEQQWQGDYGDKHMLLQVSDGFGYQWNPKLPVGSRVVPGSVTLHGVPLEPDSPYRVATNNFLAEGGDAFPMFTSGRSRANTGIYLSDAVAAYLTRRDQLHKPAGSKYSLGRIQRAPQP